LAYRQIEAKIQVCITFPPTKKQGVANVERWLFSRMNPRLTMMLVDRQRINE
jgi:hypothetical protein